MTAHHWHFAEVAQLLRDDGFDIPEAYPNDDVPILTPVIDNGKAAVYKKITGRREDVS